MFRALSLIALAVALLFPASAFSHAVMVRSSPEVESKDNASPDRVTVEFTEQVILMDPADMDVVNSEGESVITGTPTVVPDNVRAITTTLKPNLPDGTYTVRYRIVSADSHIVPYAWAFAIGPGPVGPPNLGGSTADGPSITGPWSVSARFFELLGLGGIAGLMAFRWLVWAPSWRSRWARSLSNEQRTAGLSWGRDVYWMAFGALAIGSMAAETYLLMVYSASALGTTVTAVLSNPQGVGDVLSATRLGAMIQLRGALLFALFALGAWQFLAEYGGATSPKDPQPTGPRVPALIMGTLIVVVLYGISAQGHASQAPMALVQIGADLLHLVFAAIWTAGLVALFVVLRKLPKTMGQPGHAIGTAALARFSQVAFWSIAIILVTGLVRTIGQVSALEQLWEIRYGRVLALKVGILALAGPFALYNRRIVNTLQRRAQTSPAALGLVRKAATAEVTLSVLIVLVASLLVAVVPGRV